MDVLSDDSDSEVSYNENTKSADMDEGHDTDESDLAKASDSGTDCNKKIKKRIGCETIATKETTGQNSEPGY